MSTAPARDTQSTIAALHQALAVMPDNVDAMTALGGLYLQTGRPDDGAHWCRQALARRPDHVPALNVLRVIGDTFLDAGLRVAITGDLDTTIDVFARAHACGHVDARHYLALFRQAKTWFADAKALALEPGSTRITLAVWGDGYVQSAALLFRSLLAPGNVPALAAKGRVHLEITTRAADRATLEAMPALQALRAHAQIDIFLIDEEILTYDRARLPGFHYWIQAVTHYATILRARHARSHVSFLTADCILGDGSLAAARRQIDAGKAALMFCGLEAEREGLLAAINDPGDGPLAIAPRTLVGHALDHLHADTRNLILDPDRPTLTAIPHPAMFAIDGGLIQCGFHMGPLMLSAEIAARDFAPDFLTSDTRMMRLAMGSDDYDARLAVAGDSDEIAAVSLGREVPSTAVSAPLNPDAAGKWASRWCFTPDDLPYFEWCLRQRRALRGPRAVGDVPPPSAFETQTVDAILSAFRRHATLRVSRGGSA